MADKPVLVAGATGYVGGRLVRLLLARGYRVRAMARNLSKLKSRLWAGHENLEAVTADALDSDSLVRAMDGCETAFYLIHSMNSASADFSATDRRAAHIMIEAADRAGLARIIYLGGLTPHDPMLSPHLRSRAEVAEILGSGRTQLTCLRAAQIIGAGSASFELLRYLVDRMPILPVPIWVNTECQPISIRNVIEYLAGCLEHPETTGQTYDIGGPFIETYRSLINIYAEEAGLHKRLLIPTPFLTQKLCAFALSIITPIPYALAGPLVEGMRNRVVCLDDRIRRIIPQNLMDCRTAVALALENIACCTIESSWTDAGAAMLPEWAASGDAPYAGGASYALGYRVVLRGTPAELWRPIVSIGGANGWYFGNFLWRIRGWLDTLCGGLGLGRGRKDQNSIAVGDALDCWRVLDVQPEKHLLLLSEMKMPGEGLLDFKIRSLEDNTVELVLLARFLPKGLRGLLYWQLIKPAHMILFSGLVRAIAAKTGCPVLQGPERLKI